ncbi:putative polyglutamate biosynthesis protein [Rhizodiscina lignyota]|uniref:Polyglutamate biosynthesis protein n=1 Tax=Rhizodiscina lignyota TaxID=1504668 RepID=A0A9P4IM26_9PEZI|nr:putative polyglutamate biosynthesis protein [Rhizodiscina lignyota]
MASKQLFRLNFVGDVMLGRLIDQMFATHVHEPGEASTVEWFRRRNPDLNRYTEVSPWGNTLGLFHEADLNLINLETSVTTHPNAWPNKVFNYRMHPANVVALQAANVDYASLANNHTLDFKFEGLIETVHTLKQAGIAFAGAGETTEEALKPARLTLPKHHSDGSPAYTVEIVSASDHPRDWAAVPQFHLIDYSPKTRERLRAQLSKGQPHSANGAAAPLRVFSVHWGPNYLWRPDPEARDLAHFLIDECGVDIIHGHSSHHVQGVEQYKGKLIIYGCGDFVDDYAINQSYRNDLSAIWRVTVEGKDQEGLHLKSLEIFPTRISRFQAELLDSNDPDHDWVREKITKLSGEMGTVMSEAAGDRGQLVLQL